MKNEIDLCNSQENSKVSNFQNAKIPDESSFVNNRPQKKVEQLALAMGVSITDVQAMAQGIANDLIKDKVDDIYVDSDINLQCDLVQAYAQNQLKKFQSFHTKYLTNPLASKSFQESVYRLINEQKL